MKKYILSAISLMLTCIMVFTALPLEAMAYEISRLFGENTSTVDECNLDDTIFVEYEDKSKRGQSEKHYKMSDGSYVAVKYDAPVHYYDDNDGWLDIDNTLVFESSSEFCGYVNSANSFEVKFADDSNEESLFSVENLNGNSELVFELYKQANESEAFVRESSSLMNLSDETVLGQADFDKLFSDIVYSEIYDGVDIEYSVTPTGVKENIIVYEQLTEYEFTFTISAEGLTLNLKDNGDIEAVANDSVVYVIPAPFMYDDNGRTSNDVHYTLSYVGNDIYTLNIIADKDWINSELTTFPVTIDPIVNTTPNGYGITDTYVDSQEPDANYSTAAVSTVGRKANGSINRILVDMNALPILNDCDVVVSAELYYYDINASATQSAYELHKITTDWDSTDVTWNTQPAFDSNIIDSIIIDVEDQNKSVCWDVTAFAKDYYKTGEINGLAMVSSDESVVGYSTFLSSQAANDYKPYILVKYRCQQGLEDDYTYTTYDDGQGGIAYVNNYTGTMTYVKNLFTSESEIMPAKIDLVYNSSMGDSKFSSANSYVNTCAYTWMTLSEGWKLSAQESIVPVSMLEDELDNREQTYAYIYSDEDGTEHYLCLNTENAEETVYVDEFGRGMELRCDETNNQYILKTPFGTTKTFKIISERRWGEYYNNGYIISEADEDGNTINYTYSETYPTQLISISDPSGTVISLSYTNSYVSGISMGGKTYTLSYELGWNEWITILTKVSDNYGRTVEFDYSENTGGALVSIANNDTSYLGFNYEYASYRETSYKITGVSYRTGAGGGTGSSQYTYDIGYATTIHEFGNDCAKNTDDDMYYTYTFDKGGNTKLMYAENNTRETVYATSIYGYTSGNTMSLTDSEYKLTSYADTGIVGSNLISDSSAEGESLIVSSIGAANVSKTNSEKYVGNKAYSVSSSSAGVFGISTPITLNAGNYTFSAYVKPSSDFSGKLSVRVLDENGNEIATSTPVGAIHFALNNGWMRLYVDFNAITTDEYSLAVGADGSGTFFVDAMQLEIDNGFTPSAYNILENSGFENDMSGWLKSTETDSISVLNNSKFGTKSLAVAGSYGTEYSVEQTVSIGCMPANSYIVSGWAKGEAAATNNGEKRFDLFATVNYDYLDDSGVLRASSHTTYIPFTWETREWQYVSGVVQIPDSTENKTITNVRSIDVGVLYNNCNNVQFDNIALVQDSALRISYDDGGNISSVSIDNEDSYTYEYDDNDNLTKIFDEKGELYREYFYDTEDRLITAKDGAGTTVESYTYTNSRLVSSTVDGTNNTYGYTAWGVQNSQSVSLAVNSVMKTVSSCATYDHVTKKVTSETDSLDNTVSYGYTAEMWLSMIDDANGNRTVYEYDGEDLTDQFVDSDKDGICDEGEAVVGFTYDTFGKVTGITTATTEYIFTYNTANLPVSVYVAGEETPLVTYLYNDTCTVNTGYTYANGLTICYEYDDIGNIAKILKNGEIIYTYEYDANLQVVREKDLEINAAIEYFYTDSGELYFTRKTCGDDIIEFYSITDSETGKTDYITSINGTSVTYSSIYDEENDISKYILPSLDEITSDTDEFGRTDHVYLKDSEGNVILTCTYGYVDKVVGSETRTSEYIASMSYTNGTSFIYTYAPNGNILSVSDGTNVTGYVYDELDQLVRENNQQAGKTWTYTYDKAGNILSKSEYPYSEGDLGEAADTVTYTYSTGNWGDQLVNYDGTAITYDAQGNPLNWTYDRSFSWSGRQLESITCEDSVTDFTYDANGLRVGKSVYFYDELYETTEYLLEDDRIIREVYTVEGESVVSYYYYDENGMPVAWNYDGEMYYYVKNQQGDIVEIVNESGVTKVTYTYDAWGNTISHTGNAVLFNMNPFRYRGYYYDIDTGFYYLQSRYYDPEAGRFLNADSTDYLGASGTVLGYNLYAYCENNFVNYIDPKGNFVIRRWMISAVADAVFSLIPGIGGLFAPVKTIAKTYGKASLKAKIAGPLGSLIKFISKNAAKLLYGLKNLLGKLWGVGKWVANKIPVEKTVNLIAGLTSTVAINKFINVLIPNIDIVLSVGGMISGVLDYAVDKNINNSIWVI